MKASVTRYIDELKFKLNLAILKFRLSYAYPNNNFIYFKTYPHIILSDFEPKALLNLELPNSMYMWDFETTLNDGHDTIYISHFVGYRAYGYAIFGRKQYEEYLEIAKQKPRL